MHQVNLAVWSRFSRDTDSLVQLVTAHAEIQSTHQKCVLLAWPEAGIWCGPKARLFAQASMPWYAERSAAGESDQPARFPQAWQSQQEKGPTSRGAAAPASPQTIDCASTSGSSFPQPFNGMVMHCSIL